ncbi:hypothetical protein D9M70_413830 [compost metagenome]
MRVLQLFELFAARQAPMRLGELVATGETVVVGERAGSYARYLHVIPPARRPIMFHTQAGVVRPLCSSAIGLSLLSLIGTNEVRAAVRSVRLLAIGVGAPSMRLDGKLKLVIDGLRTAIDAWARA